MQKQGVVFGFALMLQNNSTACCPSAGVIDKATRTCAETRHVTEQPYRLRFQRRGGLIGAKPFHRPAAVAPMQLIILPIQLHTQTSAQYREICNLQPRLCKDEHRCTLHEVVPLRAKQPLDVPGGYEAVADLNSDANLAVHTHHESALAAFVGVTCSVPDLVQERIGLRKQSDQDGCLTGIVMK